MSVQIKVELSGEAQRILARYRGAPTRIMPVIANAMNQANNLMLAKILPARFSGAGPFPVAEHRLGERTGHLYDSIRASDAVVEGDAVTSGIGSNLRYFGVHEFGFNGQEFVTAHLRRVVHTRLEGKLVTKKELAESGALTKAGKPRKGRDVQFALKNVIVQDFTRWMQIPERAPLRTGIRENLAAYAETISDAIVADLNPGGRL
jgi:hypothetical protein